MSNTPNQPAEPYRVRDLARMLACSEQHVRNLVARNEVPGAFVIGRLIRFQRAAVDEWIAARVKTGGG